jgi:hypothetical protein
MAITTEIRNKDGPDKRYDENGHLYLPGHRPFGFYNGPYKVTIDERPYKLIDFRTASNEWSLDPKIVYNWGGEELNREKELYRLQIGDYVRVVIEDKNITENGGWEKIYVKINYIAYYTKTSKEQRGKPKLFRGIVQDTYRGYGSSEMFISSGKEITVLPYNILEIPDWTD